MRFRTSLFILTVSIVLQFTFAWKRIGLGRPIWALPQSPNLTVLSATGTLANIDSKTGKVQWRLSHPLSTTTITPHAILYHEPYLFLAFSNQRVRAVMNDGHILWELPGCGIAQTSVQHVLPIQKCNSTTFQYVDFNGNQMDNMQNEPIPIPQLELHPAKLSWTVDNILLTSEPDGLLRAHSATTPDELLWLREEGLSHPRHAGVYVGETLSVLVILSKLGALFGLEAGNGTVMWKVKTVGDCRLFTGHETVAVVACTTRAGGTTAFAANAASGQILKRDAADAFAYDRAALEHLLMPIPSLRIVNEHGAERTILGTEKSHFGEVQDRPWLVYAKHSSSISAKQNGKTIWNVNMPSSARIEAVARSRPLHPKSSRVRPPAIRVTGDRRLLHKFVDPNIALVLAHDEKATETHALLIDTYTGTVYDIVTHPATALPASAVKGESWFAYSLWSTITMQQELHIVNMYHPPRNVSWVRDSIRAAVIQSLGPRIMDILNQLAIHEPERCHIDEIASESAQCSTEVIPEFTTPYTMPYLVRSSSLLTQRIRSLDLTETLKGLAEPAVIMTLESGQVTLVSKFLLDARRPMNMNRAYEDEYLPQYRPVISLQSHSRDSRYIDEGNHIPGLKTIAVAPHHTQESICQIAVIGTDLVYSHEYPVGNFDSLPDDFFYSGVVVMILALIITYVYTRSLNVKARLKKSW